MMLLVANNAHMCTTVLIISFPTCILPPCTSKAAFRPTLTLSPDSCSEILPPNIKNRCAVFRHPISLRTHGYAAQTLGLTGT